MRRYLGPTVVALYFLVPGVVADGTLVQTTTPVTRHYLDPLTNLVYHYDAEAGTLTLDPAGAAGNTVYAHVDVYRRGQQPDSWTGATGACASDYCVSWLLAYVGNHPAAVRVRDWPQAPGCGSVDTAEHRAPTLGLVTFWRGTWGFEHCAPGLACAHLLADGVVRWSDCTPY